MENGSEEGEAWFMLGQICTAALAVLMRLPHMRKALHNDPEFMADIERGFALSPGHLDCLYELFHLLDEEMIVLHPALQRGYRIYIHSRLHSHPLHFASTASLPLPLPQSIEMQRRRRYPIQFILAGKQGWASERLSCPTEEYPLFFPPPMH